MKLVKVQPRQHTVLLSSHEIAIINSALYLFRDYITNDDNYTNDPMRAFSDFACLMPRDVVDLEGGFNSLPVSGGTSA